MATGVITSSARCAAGRYAMPCRPFRLSVPNPARYLDREPRAEMPGRAWPKVAGDARAGRTRSSVNAGAGEGIRTLDPSAPLWREPRQPVAIRTDLCESHGL